MYGGVNSPAPAAPPTPPAGAQMMRTGTEGVLESGKEASEKAVRQVKGDEKVELQRLREENEGLRQGLASASQVIAEVENPEMPPIVGEGFVVPGDVVGHLVHTGRQLSREGLVHGHAGSISLLSTRAPGLVHITREGAHLGQMTEHDVITGRLGDAAPPHASVDWRAHNVMLAMGSLENNGLAACVHVHAPYTCAMSLESDRYVLVPKDIDGRKQFDQGAIVDVDLKNIDDYLRDITEALKQGGGKLVIARGHGIYALGRDVMEAWHNAAAFEYSMKVQFLANIGR